MISTVGVLLVWWCGGVGVVWWWLVWWESTKRRNIMQQLTTSRIGTSDVITTIVTYRLDSHIIEIDDGGREITRLILTTSEAHMLLKTLIMAIVKVTMTDSEKEVLYQNLDWIKQPEV
jgi:hypothetical protein